MYHSRSFPLRKVNVGITFWKVHLHLCKARKFESHEFDQDPAYCLSVAAISHRSTIRLAASTNTSPQVPQMSMHGESLAFIHPLAESPRNMRSPSKHVSTKACFHHLILSSLWLQFLNENEPLNENGPFAERLQFLRQQSDDGCFTL